MCSSYFQGIWQMVFFPPPHPPESITSMLLRIRLENVSKERFWWESDEESLKLDVQKQTLAFSSFFTGTTLSNLLHWACFEANGGLLYGLQTKEKLITSHIITGNAWRKNWAQPARRLKPWHLVQVVNGPLSADTPLCPKPFLIFGEGMSWLLQLSQAQLFTFPLSEQSCLCLAARCCMYVWASVSPSTSMQGYWQGALATQLIPRHGNKNNCTRVNRELQASKLQLWRLIIYVLLILLDLGGVRLSITS